MTTPPIKTTTSKSFLPGQPPEPVVRTFSTGANRDVDTNKLDYEGFLSPLVLERYAQYMHSKRRLPDGTLRDSDNWQKGMPLDVYMKSMFRHFMDVWAHNDGYKEIAKEDVETALVGLLFNVQGYLHETLKAKRMSTSYSLGVRVEPEEQLELDLQGGADLRGLAAREAGDTSFMGQVGPEGLNAVRGREGE